MAVAVEPNYNNVYIPPMPPDTPALLPYTNLNSSTQHKRNNFGPRKGKRTLGRVVSNQEDTASLTRVLQKYWGHSSWRGPQLAICKAAMEGQDVLLIAPTGLGKSVCFQVPAITMEYGITLVISPLLALMKDQVSGLQKKGVKAAMLYEKSSAQDVTYIKKQLKMGHPELRLLYLTPETLFGRKIEFELTIAYDQKQINRLIIDEAHVIEEWGLTFRAAYRDLGNFRQRFSSVPITAVTASATEEVRADILATLGMSKDRLFQRVEPFNRKNLFYEIRYQTQLQADLRQENLANFILGCRTDALRRNKKHGISGSVVSGLVYCRKRITCEEVSKHLTQKGIKSLAFHADMQDQKRQRILELWQTGEVECIVATIAFGMGVDQPHVRYVVHYDMPSSFEGYYQETGRAGRDGHLSRCVLYYSREDAAVKRNLIEKEAKAQAERKAKSGQDDDRARADTEKARTRSLNSFKMLQHYAEDTRQCRHVAICRYFGEKIDLSDEKLLEAYCNKTCDVCSNPSAVRRRALVLTEDVDIASQPRPIGALSSVTQTPFTDTISRINEVSEPSDDSRKSRVSNLPPDSMRSVMELHGEELELEIGESERNEAPSSPVFITAKQFKDDTEYSNEPRMLWSGAQNAEGEEDFEMPSSPSPKTTSFVRRVEASPVEDGFPVEDFLAEQDVAEVGEVVTTSNVPDSAATGAESTVDDDGVDEDGQIGGESCETKEEIVSRSMFRQKAYNPAQYDRLPDREPETPGPSRVIRKTGKNGRDLYQTPIHPDPRNKTDPASKSSESRYIRTGHYSLANISAKKGATVSDLIEGGYAIADPLPANEEKRQRQQEAFKAVTPITGRGPFSYYTNTAAPQTGRKRKMSTMAESGLGFRPPFKPPMFRETERTDLNVITRDDRMSAIASLKDALKKSLVEGPEADRLWRYWGEPVSSRKAVCRTAAVEIESVIVRHCTSPESLRDQAAETVASVRILRSKEGAKIVTGGKLQEYHEDVHGQWLILVDEVIRGLNRG